MPKKDQYDEWVETFEWDIPDDYCIAKEIDEFAKKKGDKVALFWENHKGEKREVTYEDLSKTSNKFANILRRLGVEKKDRVMILLPRVPEVFTVQLGVFKTGALVVPGPSMLKEKDIKYRANDCKPKVLVAWDGNRDVIENVKEELPIENYILLFEKEEGWLSYEEEMKDASEEFGKIDVDANDLMSINYTSGTTGKPKGVMHDHKWLYTFKKTNAKYWWNVQENDTIWATTSPGWAKWFWSPVGVGLTTMSSQVLYQGRFDPKKFLSLMEKYNVNRLCATPTEYRMWAQEDLENYDLSSMKKLLSAGEPLNREVIRRFREAFDLTIYDGYGQTESSGLVCNYEGIEVKPGSMGKPMPGSDARIIDEEGNEVPPDQVGEIAIPKDHPGLLVGYWGKEGKIKENLLGDLYLTSDLAKRDDNGYFWFQGRKDDVIKSSGYRIGPFEVEDALVKHPAVVEAAAVGSPHEIRGQIVKAFIKLAEGYEGSEELIEELQNFVKEETAPYKYPREIEFVEELPKTKSGKIKRNVLRERERKRKGKE